MSINIVDYANWKMGLIKYLVDQKVNTETLQIVRMHLENLDMIVK